MRILYLYQYFGTPKGSWSTRVYELTKRWVEFGHLVTVITAPYEKSDVKADGFISRQKINGIELIVINSSDNNRFSFIKRAFNAVVFAIFSIYYILIKKYDVLISSSGPISVGLPMIIAKIIRKKKTVFEVRDLWPDGGIELGLIKKTFLVKLFRWFEKQCYMKADIVVPCSIGMNNAITRRFPLTKTVVISNASDVKLFSPNGLQLREWNNNEKKTFVYTGSLGLMDDASQFIDAFLRIKRNDIELIILGDGAERPMLEKMVIKSDAQNIVFLGLRSKREVVSYLKKAYASIITFRNYPVVQTSSPNKMFDAFAAGVPIIQNTTGWIKELVVSRQCGINVPQNDPNKFAEAIQYLADNPAIRNEMSKNAYKLANTEFNRDILAEKYLESIYSIL